MRHVFIVGLFLMLSLIVGCKDQASQVCFESKCVMVEVAQTPEELSEGLQYREHLDKDKGMLFVFPGLSKAKFWMKSTLIPLDMIWLNSIGEVVYIKKNAPPCFSETCPTYGADDLAQYVLEVNAGFTDAYNINVGDGVQINIETK